MNMKWKMRRKLLRRHGSKNKKQPVVVQVQNEANFYQITQRLAKRQLAGADERRRK
jgi:hypothetical protein